MREKDSPYAVIGVEGIRFTRAREDQADALAFRAHVSRARDARQMHSVVSLARVSAMRESA